MGLRFSFLLLLFLTLSFCCEAHIAETGKVYTSFGPAIFQTHSIQTQNWLSPHVGGGIQAEADVDPYGGPIAEFYYYPKYYERVVGGGLTVSTVNKLDIALGYRYWFAPIFAVQLAVTSSYSNGPSQIISSTSAGDQNTLASKTADFGMTIGIQVEPLSVEQFSLIVDARYTQSLSANPGEDANQFMGFLGLKFVTYQRQQAEKK
jgi:hypothetical protein